ncbi:MAG TPA: DUF1659 domain-containing protein, partial [Candidatus Deferrimicrobium sp.]|nr:DUF1659 domain-containing protein [Candidatus Deferrimicrobium sp.]
MAVIATPVGSSLQLSLQVGTDTQGAPVLKKRVFGDLKVSLTDQEIFDLAGVLAALQTFPMV